MTRETETVVVPVEVPPEITDAVRRELEATSGDVDAARIREQFFNHLEIRPELVDGDGGRVVGELVGALE
jgi:hypothetical protein